MADFDVNIRLRARDETRGAIRRLSAELRKLQRAQQGFGKVGGLGQIGGVATLAERSRIGRAPPTMPPRPFDDPGRRRRGARGPGLDQTAHAVGQLGGAARSVIGAPLTLAADFEAAANRVNALSGGALKAEGKLGALEKKARELGASTEFTATQAMDAFGVLTQAGFGYEQQLASIKTVLDLATVAQIDMETAANLTANAIGGFGLKAEDAGRIGDVMARAAQASQISIQDLGESFKYAAPGAAKLGIQLEDVGTAVAVLGRSGLKGSMGGTALRAFLNRLAMVSNEGFGTKKQAMAAEALGLDRKALKKAVESGDLKNVATYMSEALEKSKLSSSGKNAAMQALFQERGALGAMILMESARLPDTAEGSWGAIEKAVNDANITLEKSAEIQRGGTKGSAIALSSALEGLGETIGKKLTPQLTELLKWAQGAVNRFSAWADANPRLVRTLGQSLLAVAALGTALAPVLLTISSLKTVLAITSGVAGFGGFSAGAAGATKAMIGLNAATLAGVGRALALGIAVGMLIDHYTHLSDRIAGVNKIQMLGRSRQVALLGSLTPEERARKSIAETKLRGLEKAQAEGTDSHIYRPDLQRAKLQAEIDNINTLGVARERAQQRQTATAKGLGQSLDIVNAEAAQPLVRDLTKGLDTVNAKAGVPGLAQSQLDVNGKIKIVVDDQRAYVDEIDDSGLPLEVETGYAY